MQKGSGAHGQPDSLVQGWDFGIFPLPAQSLNRRARGEAEGRVLTGSQPEISEAPGVRVKFHAGTLF